MVSKICERCKTPFGYEAICFDGKEIFPQSLCPSCADDREEEMEREARLREQKNRQDAWVKLCPPLYLDTDPAQVERKFWNTAERWPLDSNKGIGFIGKPGTGKTRSAFRILQRAHFAGISVQFLSATKFSQLCVEQFSDDPSRRYKAHNRLENAQKCRLLLFDDVGKAKFTERAEMEFYGLLEHRTSYLLPTIWTANSGKAGLVDMMSEDRGEPIVRRLSEFSEIVF